MQNSEFLAIFDKEVRRECEWTRMRRDGLPDLVRYTLTEVGYGGGFISWSDLPPSAAQAAIQSQIDYFSELNTDFEWKYYSYDQPTNLPELLLAHGFTAGEPEALMVADINDLPSEYWTMDVSAVQPITTPEGVDEIARMESEAWGREVSGFAAGMKHDLEHTPDHLSVFAVWQDGRVVSAAWTHYLLSTSFATLWGGSTLAPYRKRGYYTALLAARAREARQRGFRFLQVDASPNSQPILAKHGFRCDEEDAGDKEVSYPLHPLHPCANAYLAYKFFLKIPTLEQVLRYCKKTPRSPRLAEQLLENLRKDFDNAKLCLRNRQFRA